MEERRTGKKLTCQEINDILYRTDCVYSLFLIDFESLQKEFHYKRGNLSH